ncbi:uncharacterized protein LOC125038655 [Penaeus chinensis]|uniref:uncharacterized protein LOC125038655 n=1 Tax=Penaeus chinensis TaxID=139456 RepID=UPI001FB77E82|nr:uncharacterized protein LOC125038655 [Penaeus chinensis]XP_047488154.1 uncharacterized protein LOC125038655 [Penaeus chinensis]
MPRSYLRPRARPYAFNTDYYLNLSKSSGSTIESEKVEVTSQSDAQSLVERIKHSPPREVLYMDRAFSEPRFVGRARSSSYEFEPFVRPTSLEEGDVRIVTPLHLKHPYRLPVEDERRRSWLVDPVWFPNPWAWDSIWVPPHENRSQPHFGYEAYRQLILKYLELRNRKYTVVLRLCPLHKHLVDDGNGVLV